MASAAPENRTTTAPSADQSIRLQVVTPERIVIDEWVKQVADLSEDEKKQFIIKDNVGFGEWDWDDLANNWDAEQLTEWGLDIPNFEGEVLEAEEDDS